MAEGDQTADSDQSIQDIQDKVDTIGDQTADGHWMDSLPENEFTDRDRNVLKKYGDVGQLARGYMNAFNLVGRDKIPMPQTDQEWQEVYNRLGRPDEAAGYELNLNDKLPPEFKESMAKNMDWFRMTAYELGLNSNQANELYNRYANFVHDELVSQNDTVESEMTEAVTALKQELGEAYDGKMVLANRAITELGGEDLINLFEQSGMGRNPTVVKAFIKIGEMMSEETGLDTSGDAIGDSNEDLDDQIATIMGDPAYLNATDPKHKVLVQKLQKLMERRHPEPKVAPGTIRLF